MSHLIDRFLVFPLTELRDAPVFEGAGMRKILVDRRQLVGKHGVEVLDDLRPLREARTTTCCGCGGALVGLGVVPKIPSDRKGNDRGLSRRGHGQELWGEVAVRPM